jgi:hypothetical protein
VSSASTDWSPAPVWAAPGPADAPAEHGGDGPRREPGQGPPVDRRRGGRRVRRRRWIAAAIALVLLLVGVERLGRSYAEGAIADRLRDSGITGDVDVSVGSSWWRPTVLPALVTGDVDEVSVRITDGSLMGVPIDRADYALSGISGDVSLLGGTVGVRSIDRGSITIDVPPSAIGHAVGEPVTIRDGRLEMGQPARPVRARMSGDSLVLEDPAGGQPIRVPVVDPYVLPCDPALHVRERSLELSCAGRNVPGILRGPLQGSTATDADGDPAGDLAPPQSTVRPGG